MNNSDDHITRALRQQADQIQEGPLTMADITGKARSIQRRRLLASVAGAAAVVAVIAPVGILALTDSDNGTAPPASTGTPTPSTPTDTAVPGPPTYTVDLTPSDVDGTTGGEPGIPMWMDGGIAAADGTTTNVGQVVHGFVQDANGNWAGMTQSPTGDWQWTSFQDDGTVLTTEPATSDQVAVTPDGQSFAWISEFAPDSPDPKQWQLTLSGPHAKVWPLDITADSGAAVVGILDDGSVVFDLGSGGVKIARQNGSITDLGKGLLAGSSVSTATGAIAVQTSYNDDGTSCWAIVDASGASKVETCDYALGQFSTDGSLIVGMDSQSDGLGPARLYLLDADTLEPLATFEAPGFGTAKQGYFWGATAWTGGTILADVYADGEWGLAWLSPDGVKMQRSANKPGDGTEPPYLFGAGPLNPIAP